MTRIGTSHFVSVAGAMRYYGEMEYSAADVTRMIEDKEIHIGRPSLAPGQRLELIDASFSFDGVVGVTTVDLAGAAPIPPLGTDGACSACANCAALE